MSFDYITIYGHINLDSTPIAEPVPSQAREPTNPDAAACTSQARRHPPHKEPEGEGAAASGTLSGRNSPGYEELRPKKTLVVKSVAQKPPRRAAGEGEAGYLPAGEWPPGGARW